MIYAFDRCFFIKNSDEKSAKKVLGERLYTNKRIKLDFSYDIVEENDDFVTRKIIDDYCKASKEIDDYEFCELMYKDYSAKPYNINISELPAIDKESEEYQNYNPPFKGENLRISDSVELTRFKEENFDEKYGIITNIYKDMNSSDISIVGCDFRYKDELNFSYGREKGFKKAEDSAILELIERLAIYDVEGEIKKVSYDENNGLNLVNPEELLYYSQEFRNAGNKFDSSFPYKWLKVEEWGSNKGAYIPLQFFSMDVDDENYFVFESSNGVALGSSIYEAKLFALFELVERDAFLNFWYKKARLYRIDINSVEKKVQEKIARFETEDKKVYIFDMTFDISIPSILCLAVDFRGKVATYISTASHVNYNVAINAAVNECLVGHRIYETNPRIGEKEYNSDYDVVEMFDHVNHASRREYIKNYDFLFESEVKTVEELYGSESYKISDSIDDAKDLLDFICKTKLNNHGKIYFADLSTKMSYEYGFFVAKIVVSGMLPMTFGYANQRINRERIKNAIQNSKYSDRCLCKGDEIDDRAHPFP